MNTIKSRIISGFLVAILALAGITIIFVSKSMRNIAEESYIGSSTQQLRLMNDYVEFFIDIAMRDLAVIAKNPDIANAKNIFPSFVPADCDPTFRYSELPPEALNIARQLARLSAAEPNYVEVYLGYEDGAFATSANNSTLFAGFDPSKRPWYLTSKASPQNTSVSQGYLSTGSASGGEIVFSVMHKMFNSAGAFAGVASLDMTLAGISENFKKVSFGKTGYFILLESSGRVLCDPRHADFIGKIITRDLEDPGMVALFNKANGAIPVTIQGVDMRANILTNKHGWKIVTLQAESEIFAASNAAIRSVVIISGIIILAVLIFAFFLVRSINTPLNRIVDVADKIARGDIAAAHSGKGFYGELAKLYASLINMVKNLQHMIATAEQKSSEAERQTKLAEQASAEADSARLEAEKAKRDGMLTAATQLQDVVSVISSAAVQLSGQLGQSNRSAADSASQLDNAANAISGMNSAIRGVSHSFSAASTISHDTKENAENGAKIVQQALQSIDHVHSVSMELKSGMTLLDGHAQAITNIMGVISDIADQTNLLALNAAIEAARAGDAGRGFAVVADEVRKLAEKTTHSTQDVSNAINAIQKSAATSVASVDNALQQVEIATDFAKQSGEALRVIVTNANATADQVQNIAAASEEQSANCEEISKAVAHANGIARQTADNMSEALQSVENLTRQARVLSELIQHMKE